MHLTDFAMLDGLLSIAIAVFILYNVVKNLKQALTIFLQGTPSNISLEKVHQAVKEVEGVIDFHDCHIWSMDGEDHILTIHLVIDENNMKYQQELKNRVKEKLHPFGIHQATIELECIDTRCYD